MNPPGLFYGYCNPGYSLAGHAAEILSGKPFAKKLNEDVLTPLSLTATTFDPAEVMSATNYATGTSEGASITPDSYDNGAARPAGYLWSNVIDLSSLGMQFLNRNDAVLSTEGMDAMLSPQISTNVLGEHSNYGYGWSVEQGFWTNDGLIPLPHMHHSGAIPGYSATLIIIPDLSIGMVALAATDGAYLTDSFYEAIELYGLPSSEPFPSDIYFDSADLDSYAGTYNDDFNIGEVIITNDNGVLRIDAPTLDQFEVPYDTTVTPYTKDHVYWNVQGYPFRWIIRDDNDQVTYFVNRFLWPPEQKTSIPRQNTEQELSHRFSPNQWSSLGLLFHQKISKGTVFTSWNSQTIPHIEPISWPAGIEVNVVGRASGRPSEEDHLYGLTAIQEDRHFVR